MRRSVINVTLMLTLCFDVTMTAQNSKPSSPTLPDNQPNDLRKIAEGDPSVFWRMADGTRLEMSEDGGVTFRTVTVFSERPSLLSTRADRPNSVLAHFEYLVAEVNDQGAVSYVRHDKARFIAEDYTDEMNVARSGKRMSPLAVTSPKCSYTVSDKIIYLGGGSGINSMYIKGTCPWTVVTDDQAFARFLSAETKSPILLPNKNLNTATAVRIEHAANLSINARGTVLLVLDASGRIVASTTLFQFGYNSGRSSPLYENLTAEVRLTAKAQPFEVKFRAFCRTCEYPGTPVSWITRIGEVPQSALGSQLTLGFQASENKGLPRAWVMVMYEYLKAPYWSAVTTVIQDAK